MIFDQISNWELYPLGPAWAKAFEFLNGLSPDAEEKKYPLDGEDIFGRVMSYDTRPTEEAKLEAHMQYVDIQATLAGVEAMEIFPTHQPEIQSPYDETKDVIFFKHTPDAAARIVVQPGWFVVFFPDDAHMPQLQAGEKPERIKKVVVKVRKELLK